MKSLKKYIPEKVRKAAWNSIFTSQKKKQDVFQYSANIGAISKGLACNFVKRSESKSVAAVFAGRNDDYVPDNVLRIKSVIEWNSKVLCDEVVFVEWNPPSDRPLLSPELTKIYPNLRCFVVSKELHEKYCTNSRMPVMEYHAKNVGIRRANSDYICATNSDILWDTNIKALKYILSEKYIYRTKRIELLWDGSAPSHKYLRDKNNIIEFRNGWRQEMTYGCGDFTLAHKSLWHKAKGYDESLTSSRLNCDGRGLLQLRSLANDAIHWGYHYHLYHETTSTAAGNSSHGEGFKYWEDLPYENSDWWGMGNCSEDQISERVWILR